MNVPRDDLSQISHRVAVSTLALAFDPLSHLLHGLLLLAQPFKKSSSNFAIYLGTPPGPNDFPHLVNNSLCICKLYGFFLTKSIEPNRVKWRTHTHLIAHDHLLKVKLASLS